MRTLDARDPDAFESFAHCKIGGFAAAFDQLPQVRFGSKSWTAMSLPYCGQLDWARAKLVNAEVVCDYISVPLKDLEESRDGRAWKTEVLGEFARCSRASRDGI
jgi:hypothetical protein